MRAGIAAAIALGCLATPAFASSEVDLAEYCRVGKELSSRDPVEWVAALRTIRPQSKLGEQMSFQLQYRRPLEFPQWYAEAVEHARKEGLDWQCPALERAAKDIAHAVCARPVVSQIAACFGGCYSFDLCADGQFSGHNNSEGGLVLGRVEKKSVEAFARVLAEDGTSDLAWPPRREDPNIVTEWSQRLVVFYRGTKVKLAGDLRRDTRAGKLLSELLSQVNRAFAVEEERAKNKGYGRVALTCPKHAQECRLSIRGHGMGIGRLEQKLKVGDYIVEMIDTQAVKRRIKKARKQGKRASTVPTRAKTKSIKVVEGETTRVSF